MANCEKCFSLKELLKPVGVVVHVVIFSWNNNNVAVESEFLCSLQELYLHGSMNLNRTTLQSIYILYFAFSYYFFNRKLPKSLKLQFSKKFFSGSPSERNIKIT